MRYVLILCMVVWVCLQGKAQTTVDLPQATFATQAQPAQQLSFRIKPVYIGASVGGNISAMNFNKGYPKPSSHVENHWKPGFTAGLLLGAILNKKFTLQQEYLWSRLQSKDTNSDTDHVFDYLSLPILIQYTVYPRISFLVGPQFDLLIQAKERANGQTSNTTHDTEERSIGATGGVGVRLSDHVSINARYTHGLNHINLKNNSGMQEFKFQSVQVSVATIF